MKLPTMMVDFAPFPTLTPASPLPAMMFEALDSFSSPLSLTIASPMVLLADCPMMLMPLPTLPKGPAFATKVARPMPLPSITLSLESTILIPSVLFPPMKLPKPVSLKLPKPMTFLLLLREMRMPKPLPAWVKPAWLRLSPMSHCSTVVPVEPFRIARPATSFLTRVSSSTSTPLTPSIRMPYRRKFATVRPDTTLSPALVAFPFLKTRPSKNAIPRFAPLI